MNKNTVALAVAAVAVVTTVKTLKKTAHKRAIAAIDLETQKSFAALHLAGERLHEEIAAGHYANKSVADVLNAFDFHVIAARTED